MVGNIEIARQFYKFIGEGQLKSLLDLLHEDVLWEVSSNANVPYFGSYKGKQRVEQFFENLLQVEEILKFEPEVFFEAPDAVAVLGSERCRARSTQIEFACEWVQIFEFREGRISHWKEIIDSWAIARAYDAI